MVVLETPRLILRRFEPQDLEPLHALYSDPEIRRYYPDGVYTREQTLDELQAFLDGHRRYPELGLWATLDRASGAFLGRCGLLPWQIDGKLEVELAFLITKSRWREGLATEASLGIIERARAVLGLQRLICLVMPGNAASAGVATKVGMRFEREHTDEYGPCHLYSMRL